MFQQVDDLGAPVALLARDLFLGQFNALKQQVFEKGAQFCVVQKLAGRRLLPGYGVGVEPVEFEVEQQIAQRHMARQAAPWRSSAGPRSWPLAGLDTSASTAIMLSVRETIRPFSLPGNFCDTGLVHSITVFLVFLPFRISPDAHLFQNALRRRR